MEVTQNVLGQWPLTCIIFDSKEGFRHTTRLKGRVNRTDRGPKRWNKFVNLGKEI